MDLMHQCLSLELPQAASKDADKESALDAVKAAVCANINLPMEKEEELFEPFMQTFVQDVWGQLVKVRGGTGRVGEMGESSALELVRRGYRMAVAKVVVVVVVDGLSPAAAAAVCRGW